jgi:ATP-dependent Clp protease ATP-binding subunit ClpC
MYERFTDRSRKVMQLANQEAQRFNHEYIGTEHILLALIKEGAGVAANVLKNLDIDLRKVRLEVEKVVMAGPDRVTMGKLPQTPRAKKVIEYSIEEARNLKHNYVGTEHLLLGLLREQEGVAAQVLMNLGLDLGDAREEILSLLGHNPERADVWAGQQPGSWGKNKTPALDAFGIDLTALARDGRLAPCVGRANEIDRVLLVLGCLEDCNPLLVGPAGVGKRSVVHGLARLAAGDTPPEFLRGRRIVQVSVRAGVLHHSNLSEKFTQWARDVAKEARQAGNVLVFVDDLIGYAPAGRLFKAALDAAEVPYLAAVTPEAYRAAVADDPVFARNLQPVLIESPPADEVLAVLRAQRSYYEDHHRVQIADDALDAAAQLSERHLTDGCQPAKALRLLDQAAALYRLSHAVPPPDTRPFDAEVERLNAEKESAVAGHDFERAARLRDQADGVKKERDEALAAWRLRERQPAGVVDAVAVEAAVTKLTGVQFRGSDAIRPKPGGRPAL